MALKITESINSIRTSVALALLPKRSTQEALTNVFNQAFFAYVGGGMTRYDPKAPTYIDKGYNENSDVYSVVSQIAMKFASVPGILNEVKEEKSLKEFKSYYRRALKPNEYVKKILLETKALDNEEISDPMPRPNWYQSETEYKQLWETFMLLTGNAYQWMMRVEDGVNKGKPMARFLLPSHMMQIVLKKDAKFNTIESPIDYYILTYGNSFIRFEADDVIHTKYPNPNYDFQGSHLYGQAPLKAALIDLQIQNVTNENSAKSMKSGGMYGFIHAKDGQTPLTPDQATDLKSRLLEMQASEQSLGRIAGASAPLGFTQISVDTDKLMPFDYLKSSQRAICNVLNWSTLLLNNDAKYDNLDAVWKMVISNRISPDLKIYEDALNDKYYPLFPQLGNVHLTFDISEMPEMQPDMKTLTEWLTVALNAGAITPREFRIALRYSDMDTPEMNTHFIQQGLIPIADAVIPDQNLLRDFNVDA